MLADEWKEKEKEKKKEGDGVNGESGSTGLEEVDEGEWMLVVRPDQHVAFVGQLGDEGVRGLERYFEEVLAEEIGNRSAASTQILTRDGNFSLSLIFRLQGSAIFQNKAFEC